MRARPVDRSTPSSTRVCERIRGEFDVPGGFPADGRRGGRSSGGTRVPGTEHVDRTDVAFVTLDPASSTDLDQAFAIERWRRRDLVLHYAIADVAFVRRRPATRSTPRRGAAASTVYLPDGRAGLYPPVLSEGAASLLPDGPRPAVVFTVRVDADGAVALDGVERAIDPQPGQARLRHGRSRATCPTGSPSWRAASLPPRSARGADRVEFPEQELDRADGGVRRCASGRGWPVEDAERGAVAGDQPGRRRRAARRRHRPVPGDGRADERAVGAAAPHGARVRARLAGRRRRSPSSSARCDATTRAAAAFLLAVRRAGGGAALRAVHRRASCRGTRRWRRPTSTPRRRCAGSPTAT